MHSKKENDLSKKLWARKFRAWKDVDMTIVAISHWLAECARSSSLFKNRRIEVIHNGLDEKLFKPMPKKVVREILGLPLNKKIILFGALGAVADKRKGYAYLKPALEELASGGRAEDTELVVFGSSEPEDPPRFAVRANYMGTLHDDLTLSMVYAGADVTVVPSTEEAFGKTAMESLACGTPVVSFDTTGLKDIVEHKENGYRAKCFEAGDLACGIAWVLEDEGRRQALSRRAREKVEEEFTLEIQARKYMDLYREVLKGG